jgi:hypothetical protein
MILQTHEYLTIPVGQFNYLCIVDVEDRAFKLATNDPAIGKPSIDR